MKQFIVLIVYCFSVFGEDTTVYLLTLPKAGTHLIQKYFTMIAPELEKSHIKIKSSHLSEKHLNLPKGYLDASEIKKMVMVRDLRDLYCSVLDYIVKSKHFLQDGIQFTQEWEKLSSSQKLYHIIDESPFSQKGYIWGYHETLSQKLTELIDRAIYYSNKPNTLVVRYEALAGPKAGVVTEEEMKDQINQINEFLGIKLTPSKFDEVLAKLYGNDHLPSYYFNRGKSDRWKELFDQGILDLFNNKLGSRLEALGYKKQQLFPQ